MRHSRTKLAPLPVLDTHVWLWWLLGDARLDAKARDFLEFCLQQSRPVLADISLWEMAMLVSLGRLQLDQELEAWLSVAAAPATVRVEPISPEIVVEMNRLPASFHRDPADRLIVATARTLKAPLATYDQRIAASGLVEIWKP